MLSEAADKSSIVKWFKFDVEQTDFPSNNFDGAICSLAIHHFPNLVNAFKEISRILKPTAKMVLFTATPEQMSNYWLIRYFPNMIKNRANKCRHCNL
jgi:ubiquinone/menaquinone biosynthesis C-methylase UbiE